MEDSYLSALFLGEALLLQLLHPGRGDRAEPLQGGERRPQGRGEGRLQGEREGQQLATLYSGHLSMSITYFRRVFLHIYIFRECSGLFRGLGTIRPSARTIGDGCVICDWALGNWNKNAD